MFIRPGGGIGRHAGLKILSAAMRVTVQLRSGAHLNQSDLGRFYRFMSFVYILYSEKCDRYYVGFCADLQVRLQRHNAGFVTATRNCRPYVLKASKPFQSELEARKEESRIKSKKVENILSG